MKSSFELKNFKGKQDFNLIANISIKEQILSLEFEFISTSKLEELFSYQKEITTNKRQDNLWKHTCFEIFLKQKNTDSYYEYNFSPSGEWNAYSFEGERRGMKEIAAQEEPIIENFLDSTKKYKVSLNIKNLDIPLEELSVSICAVIETPTEHQYFSTKHTSNKPDFHKQDSFISLA